MAVYPFVISLRNLRLARGAKVERALRSATKAAALSVGHSGAAEHVPTPAEVESAYRL